MVTSKVLIVNKMHRSILPMLSDLGWKVDYRPSIKRAEILTILSDYQGLIIRSKTVVDRELISYGKDLQFVARAGAGIDQIDMKALEEKGISMINAPEGNRTALGEQTIGMLLSLLHNVQRANSEVKNGIWQREENRGLELSGRTVGIYGYGYMGSAFAERLSSFGCRVIGFDKYKEEYEDSFIQEVSKEHFEQETEILSIHVPLTSETKGYFTEEYLRRYPNLKFLLNTSRGEVLDLQAVSNLLKEGKIKAAALDVLENEKLKTLTLDEKKVFDELASNENVIMTPHIAGWTEESYVRINQVIINKMIELGLSTNLARTSKN